MVKEQELIYAEIDPFIYSDAFPSSLLSLLKGTVHPELKIHILPLTCSAICQSKLCVKSVCCIVLEILAVETSAFSLIKWD